MTATSELTEQIADSDRLTYIRRDATSYLDKVATDLNALKHRLVELFQPQPGQQLLDVGCGTGVDVFTLAERVIPGGSVTGVDSAPELIQAASDRTAPGYPVRFQVADAHRLPFADNQLDGARSERVLQHVADPGQAIAELVRVTKPGGRVLVADPDHGMWAPDLADLDLTRRLMSFWVDHIRNPWMGRRLPGLLAAAGVTELSIELLPIVMTDLKTADRVIGLADIAAAAVNEGAAEAGEAEAWHADLMERESSGRLLVCGVIVAATGIVGPAAGTNSSIETR